MRRGGWSRDMHVFSSVFCTLWVADIWKHCRSRKVAPSRMKSSTMTYTLFARLWAARKLLPKRASIRKNVCSVGASGDDFEASLNSIFCFSNGWALASKHVRRNYKTWNICWKVELRSVRVRLEKKAICKTFWYRKHNGRMADTVLMVLLYFSTSLFHRE